MDLLERLGLGGRRVLILHHDDLGLTHAQNGAYQALGLPTGSVMVPGPGRPRSGRGSGPGRRGGG